MKKHNGTFVIILGWKKICDTWLGQAIKKCGVIFEMISDSDIFLFMDLKKGIILKFRIVNYIFLQSDKIGISLHERLHTWVFKLEKN